MINRQSHHRPFLHGHIGKRLFAWLADPGNLLAALGLMLLVVLVSAALLQPDKTDRQSASGRHVMANCFWTLHDAVIADDEVSPGCGDDADANADAGTTDRDNAAPAPAAVFVAGTQPWPGRAGGDAWHLPER